MSSNLIKCFEKFKEIAEFNLAERKKLIEVYSNSDRIYWALFEIVRNILNKSIPMSDKRYEKLDKFHRTVKMFKYITKSQSKRRKMIKASADYLPIIVPPVEAALKRMEKSNKD